MCHSSLYAFCKSPSAPRYASTQSVATGRPNGRASGTGPGSSPNRTGAIGSGTCRLAGFYGSGAENIRKPARRRRRSSYKRARALLTVYADTSFLVSLYVLDAHSDKAHRRVANHPRIWLTALHRIEWAHAVSQHVFHGQMLAHQARQVFDQFEQDRRTGLWLEATVSDSTFEICFKLARQYIPRVGARTLDTLHIASALELKADRFWTFDARQARLATGGGIANFLACQRGSFTVDRRARWGIGLELLAYTLLWQGPFWNRSLARWQVALSILFFLWRRCFPGVQPGHWDASFA